MGDPGLSIQRIPPRPVVVFGAGAAGSVARLVRGLGADSAFVVTGRRLVGAGVTGPVVDGLVRAGLRTGLYDTVGRNPSLETVLEGSLALRAFGPSVVVAVGGGSVMAAAKAIALHAANDRPVRELDQLAAGLHAAGPLIAVPTTAGTGAETNGFGVIDDPVEHRKRYLGHPSTLPRYAVLDPLLTMSAPPAVTAACGVGVLARAVESLQARAGNARATALALEAVRGVMVRLPAAVADGCDLGARSELLRAAHLAGLASGTTGLGAAHALGHALAARHDIGHGVALATVLALVVERNLADREAETARLAAAVGVPGGAAAVPAAIAELQERIGVHPRLSRLLIPRRDLDALAVSALEDPVIANAPRDASHAELVGLLQAAY